MTPEVWHVIITGFMGIGIFMAFCIAQLIERSHTDVLDDDLQSIEEQDQFKGGGAE